MKLLYKDDGLHFTTREIDGHHRPFNAIISEREDGKSTAVIIGKAVRSYIDKGTPSLIFRRRKVDITDIYIDDLSRMINKFIDQEIKINYSMTSLRKFGMVDLKIGDKVIFRLIAISTTLSNLKSLFLPNVKYFIFDEFICNTRLGEKYVAGEAFRFSEIYRTFNREAKEPIICYFLGNPYSLYNPFFVDWGVPTKKLKRGVILTGKNWAVQCHEMKPELKEYIIAHDPTYQFDNSYTRYSFDGANINDSNIPLYDKLPENYRLLYVFKIDEKMMGIYQNTNYLKEVEFDYCIEFINFSISKRRDIYVFDFKDLIEKSIVVANEDRFRFSKIKNAMRKRRIEFHSIECYYLFEDIYTNL